MPRPQFEAAFSDTQSFLAGPRKIIEITPHDTDYLSDIVRVWIPNSDGVVTFDDTLGNKITDMPVKAGLQYVLPATRFYATGTDSTKIFGGV